MCNRQKKRLRTEGAFAVGYDVSSSYQEDGVAFVEVDVLALLPPLCCGEGADGLCWQGDVAGDADHRVVVAGFGKGLQHLVVAVGGFDEDLCLSVAECRLLERANGGVSLLSVDG